MHLYKTRKRCLDIASMEIMNVKTRRSYRVQVGESGKSTRDLERTIALLKKVVERIQAENERLKETPGVLLATSELGPLRAENETLRRELEELRSQTGGKLADRYNATQQGTCTRTVLVHCKVHYEYSAPHTVAYSYYSTPYGTRATKYNTIEHNEPLRGCGQREADAGLREAAKGARGGGGGALPHARGARGLTQTRTLQAAAAATTTCCCCCWCRAGGAREAMHCTAGGARQEGVLSAGSREMRGSYEECSIGHLCVWNKLLSDVRIYLKESAQREQQLIGEKSEFERKVSWKTTAIMLE